MTNKASLYVVSSHPYFINHHCLKQINSLTKNFKVTLFCDLRNGVLSEYISPTIIVKRRKFGRKPNFFYDIFNLFALVCVFKFDKPDIVLSFSPKVGFLAMLASRVSGVKHRVHFFTGQIWVTKKGLLKVIYRSLEKLTAINSTDILVDSKKQSQFLIEQGIGNNKKNNVLGDGSVGGVDTTRFSFNLRAREILRKKLNIANTTTVFLFLGRLTEDKGVLPLLSQIEELIDEGLDIHLILAGPNEGLDISSMISKHNPITHTTYLGDIKNPEEVISASDVLCLISRREGFGKVVIEAASCGIPAIVSDIYGLRDSVIQDKTGLVVELDNARQLSNAIIAMCDKTLRKQLGDTARQRVKALFTSDRMTQLWLDFFWHLWESKS